MYLACGMLMVAGMAGLVATAAALIRLSAGLRRPGLLRAGAILIGVWGVCGVGGVSLGFTAGWVGAHVRGDVGAEALSRVFEGINILAVGDDRGRRRWRWPSCSAFSRRE